VRPHIGMQFVQFEEKRRFSGVESESEIFDHSIDSHIKQKFHGWGLRGGADMQFPLFCDITLVGGIAASIDWGKRSTSWNIANEFTEGTVEDAFYQKRHDKVNRSILDLSLGLRWDTTFCNCWGFSLEALWEQHQLFNASQLWHLNNRLINDNSLPGSPGNNGDKHGDLSLRGLTVRAALTF
ncbi:MAG: Lpg1974 family pore-forming outer membrane protein, partial [Parachlamydiaceae bacterium]